MNVNAFLQKDYENEPLSGPKKTNPKQTQFPKCQNERKIGCIHISKKYNVLIRKVLDSQTNFFVKNGLY